MKAEQSDSSSAEAQLADHSTNSSSNSSSGVDSLLPINSNAAVDLRSLQGFLKAWFKEPEPTTPTTPRGQGVTLITFATPETKEIKKEINNSPETPGMKASPAPAILGRHNSTQGNHTSAHSFIVYTLKEICNSNDDYLCKLQKIKNLYEMYCISPGESIKEKINEILKNIELYDNPNLAGYKDIVENEIKRNLELLLDPTVLPKDFIKQQHESGLGTIYGDKKVGDKGDEDKYLGNLEDQINKIMNLNKDSDLTEDEKNNLVIAISALFDANNIGTIIKDSEITLEKQTSQEKQYFLKKAILGHLVEMIN